LDYKSLSVKIISWISGILFSAIGIVNMFWGNDNIFGVFLFVLSLVFYPPVNRLFKKLTNYAIPIVVKIILGIFIFWVSLGVGELFAKIDMMMKSF
jgi:hypothetical protein